MCENSQKIYRDIEMKDLNGLITEEDCQLISIYYTYQSNNITFRKSKEGSFQPKIVYESMTLWLENWLDCRN